ncbi:MAG: hypothetical protein DI587_10995 [Variovorax paradoxus]|nr:MAG: hypothetical protein DI583_10995 [Variovorax paradoxus]PZQ10979.1 MAG: hypothetical protein DI587_10995 [Variovorax paradoxus]
MRHADLSPVASAGPGTIRRVALFGWCTLLAGVLLPSATAAALWRQSGSQWLAQALPTTPDVASAVSEIAWPVWAVVATLAMAPVLVMGMALLWAGLGLLRVATAQALSQALVIRLRLFASCTLAAAVLGMLCPTLIGLVLSAALDGPMRLAIALDSRDLVLLLFAAVTWQLADVIKTATAIADEHAQIV